VAISAAEVVKEAHRLFHFVRTPAGEPYAIPKTAGKLRIALTLDQAATDLAAAFLSTGEIPSPQTMQSALTVLTAVTRNAEVCEVFLRLARHGDATFLDLGTRSGEYVEITADGWWIREPRRGDECPALFYRSATTNPLPIPERGGARDELATLLALRLDDDRFRVAWGWLVAQVFPETARPLIYFLGTQGSGKTTRGLMLANVLEPQTEMGAVLKRSEKENNVVARANYILTSDNMTKMSEDISNWLCSLVTGHRVVERLLYTNADTFAYSLKRTGIFTGKIKPAGLESDAEERMIFLEFERMTVANIRADDDLMADLREAHPRILGAVLTDMAAVLARVGEVTIEQTSGYRFINFAKCFVAMDTVDAPGYIDALNREATEAQIERVHDEPVLIAVLRVVATEDEGEWTGTAADLLNAMARYAPDDAGRPGRTWWPASPKGLSTHLRKQQHALNLAGLSVDYRKSNGTRLIHATVTPEARERWAAPQSIADIADTLGGGRK
jgi:energy-coupling factor transporter ATP-binding protein EcfA2